MRSGMIEELCERQSKSIQTRPIQVAQGQAMLRFALSFFDQRHLCGEIFPAVGVVDESVDPLPELRVYRVVEFPLPPKIKWQVRIQIGEDDARKLSSASAFEQKRNLFGANLFLPTTTDVTMRANPGFYAIFIGLAVGFDDNRAAGVILGDFRHQLRIVIQGARFFAVSGKVHKRRARNGAFAFLPQFFQLLLNLSNFDRST